MTFDAIVVGAGPAGSAAALVLARAGHRTVLLERGPFPGSKNMYGGVVYPRVLDEIIPRWWEEMPVQRWVTRRSTMVLTDSQALTVDYRSDAWGEPPYNGATALRPELDAWLASKAEEAGATLVCSTTATGLIRERGRVVGVRTDRPDGDLRAPVVIACDGVNSFLAKEAGLYTHTDPSNYTLGVKETLGLPRETIEERFGLRGLDGADFEILGCTGDVPGGGFLYTKLDTLAVGVVLQLPGLAAQPRRPEDFIARLKAHPAIAPYVEGAEVKEYSAHLIPKGGWKALPKLSCAGMLVAGDAAALCLAAGIWLEGVNFALGSGIVAGRVASRALQAGDLSADALGRYRSELEQCFVLADHKKLRDIPSLVMNERLQRRVPGLACNMVERLYRVDNPDPKPGLVRIAREEIKRSGLRYRDLITDSLKAFRGFR